MGISFLFSFIFASFLFPVISKASSDSHFAFLHFSSMGVVLIPVYCTMLRTSIHSYQALCLSDVVPEEKVLYSICQQIWKIQQWPQDWKWSVFISTPNKGNAKECLNCCTIPLTSHASKVMLKILQARLQQYMNHELPDVQAGIRKGRGIRDQIANIHWKKQESSRETSISALLTMPNSLCGSQ